LTHVVAFPFWILPGATRPEQAPQATANRAARYHTARVVLRDVSFMVKSHQLSVAVKTILRRL